jgi:hypothetical protein
MYLVGQGHEHLGPGTSMVQRINWTQHEEMQLDGFGCACAEGHGLVGRGLGLFDSGLDVSTWGVGEWAVVAFGVYAGMSLLGDTKRGVARTRRVASAVRRAV